MMSRKPYINSSHGYTHSTVITLKYCRLIRMRLGTEFKNTIKDNGIELHVSAAYAKEQNGPAERSGGMLIEVGRTLHTNSKIPKNLWPQSYHCAAYLLNRTPNRALGWKTPYEVAHEQTGHPGKKPYIGHLRIFGTRVYEKIPAEKIPRKDKMATRSLIGYLVGYEATNQFLVWNPRNGTVTKRRDVTFDEKLRFDPQNPYIEDVVVDAIPRQTTTLNRSNEPAMKILDFDQSDSEEEDQVLDEDSSAESPESSGEIEHPPTVINEEACLRELSERPWTLYDARRHAVGIWGTTRRFRGRKRWKRRRVFTSKREVKSP
jgi:hypothetical protein